MVYIFWTRRRCLPWFLAGASLPLAAGKLCRQRVEALVPEPPERLEPGVELPEWSGVDRVQSARAVWPNGRKPAVTEDLEVLRHGRLRNPELLLDDRRDRTRRDLAVSEQLEDPASNGIPKDVECVHDGNVQ